jgi:uncharacterized protein YlaI
MENSRDYSDFFIAACAAEGYCRTAEFIRPYAKNGIDMDSLIKFSCAYVINMAFACELYLKSLLLYWGKDIPKTARDGHDLRVLYDKLELCDRQMIESKYDADTPIDTFLGNECRIFVTHRYPYEKNESRKSVFYKPFEAFMEALAYTCVNRQHQHLNGGPDHAD